MTRDDITQQYDESIAELEEALFNGDLTIGQYHVMLDQLNARCSADLFYFDEGVYE